MEVNVENSKWLENELFYSSRNTPEVRLGDQRVRLVRDPVSLGRWPLGTLGGVWTGWKRLPPHRISFLPSRRVIAPIPVASLMALCFLHKHRWFPLIEWESVREGMASFLVSVAWGLAQNLAHDRCVGCLIHHPLVVVVGGLSRKPTFRVNYFDLYKLMCPYNIFYLVSLSQSSLHIWWVSHIQFPFSKYVLPSICTMGSILYPPMSTLPWPSADPFQHGVPWQSVTPVKLNSLSVKWQMRRRLRNKVLLCQDL